MILVTGTKRAGTSLWMQILMGAGFPAFGEAFPANWEATLKDANPEGFYESSFRNGIYYATNPSPRTGKYVFPEQVERHVVKVFIPGLVRTDRAYIGRVVATLRDFREYVASVERLYAIEDASLGGEAPARISPALEWWTENYALVRDISVRRYAAHVESYGRLMRDPERVIREVVAWLGHGDADSACARVRPEHRHFERPATEPIEPEFALVFDELYQAVDQRRGLSGSLIQKLNETHQLLLPGIRAEEERLRLAAVSRRR